MQNFHYNTCCVNSDGASIIDMVDRARKITPKTFFSHVSRQEVESLLGYDKAFRISQDYHVRYYKSVYKGLACYYANHSAIEYIFTA